MDVNVEVSVYCICGEELPEGRLSAHRRYLAGTATIVVEPCNACMAAAKEEAVDKWVAEN